MSARRLRSRWEEAADMWMAAAITGLVLVVGVVAAVVRAATS